MLYTNVAIHKLIAIVRKNNKDLGNDLLKKSYYN